MVEAHSPDWEQPAYPDELSGPRRRRDFWAAVGLIVFGLLDLWQSVGAYGLCTVSSVTCSSPAGSFFLWLQLLSGPALVAGGIVVYLRSPLE